MQKAILYVNELNITQRMNEKFSHDGDLAIDISKSCKNLKAPFDLVIKRIYTPCNAIFCESLERVEYADGTIDYMNILLIHDDDIKDLKVGMKIKQGTTFYQPGKKGKAKGSHIHIACARGKYLKWIRGLYQPKVKTYAWILPKQKEINDCLFLDKNVKVTKGIYRWKIANSEIKQVKTNIKYAKACDKKINSIVDGLISVGLNYSFEYRNKLAELNNISNYKGTSTQNNKLLNLLKKGILIIEK